jgi:apolipoprotein N-acyltransferase
MKRFSNLFLSLLGAALLSIGWPPVSFPFLFFFAFVPFFLLEDKLRKEDRLSKFPRYLYLGLLLWNICTTWWVWYASPGGAIAMLLANSALMTLPFLAYRYSRKILSQGQSLMAFVFFWIAFEYLHFHWELAYPWLALGNSFATSTELIQWYEYTGVSGGTLWILLANVLIYQMTRSYSKRVSFSLVIVLIAPIIYSNYLGNQQSKCIKNELELLVVQPNIDPYNKFAPGEELNQVDKFIQLVEDSVTDHTDYVILPETAIVEYLDESQLKRSQSIHSLQNFLKRHEGLRMITGASTYRYFEEGETPSPTARETSEGFKYDSYNTALVIDSNGVEDVYHKSKLVPGVERMPYPAIFRFMEYFTIDMGGISGSLGTDKEAKTFNTKTHEGMAPLICYESIFGDYARSFVLKGAKVMLVVTNDGWWRNTPGYKQHMHYARLRAIENRREVVRSANTGISCHIDDNGRVLQQSSWWEPAVLRVHTKSLSYRTFYTTNGDVIGKIGSFLAIFLFISIWVRRRVIKSGVL